MRRVLICLALTGILSLALASPLHSAKRVDGKKQPKRTTTEAAERQAEPARSKPVGDQTTKSVPTTPATRTGTDNTIDRNTTPLPESDAASPSTSSVQDQAAPAADLQIDWISINHGGATEVASGDLRLGVSVAQTVAGEVSSENHRLGLGFWYVTAGGAADCNCPSQGDLDSDGSLTILDFGSMVDVIFAGLPDIQDPDCPATRTDFDNNGFPDVLDVGAIVDHMFLGADGPCDPCNPVQGSCAP